jgi:hypothetical protein
MWSGGITRLTVYGFDLSRIGATSFCAMQDFVGLRPGS